jgi:hypothetical protein
VRPLVSRTSTSATNKGCGNEERCYPHSY